VTVVVTSNTQRPLNTTIAAILLEVFSALNLVSPLILGASEEVPAVVAYLHVALGVAGLVASAGLWILKKWGVAMAVMVSVLNALSATPGVSFAPTADLFGSAVVGVAVFALIVVLVVLPGTLRDFT
jgi:hypothetical protein